MAYEITYQWNRETSLMKQKQMHWNLFAMLALACFFLLLLWSTADNSVTRELLHPLLDPKTMDAVGEMISQVQNGSSVPEALTAFCIQILDYAS